MTDKERREWYLSHGICPHCGRNDLQKGYKRCLECRMKDNEAHRNKPIESGKLCAECYEYLVQQAAHMRSKQNNSEHLWRKESSADVDIIKHRQTNGEPPRIDFNVQGGKVTLEENKRHTEAI